MNKYELESIMESLSLSGRVGIDENRTSSKPNSKKDAIINSIVSKIKSKTNLPAKDIKEYLCGYGDSDRIATGKKLKEVYDTKMINRYKDECRQFDESTEYYDKYDSIYNIIQESYDDGKIILEEAEVLNDYAYDRYMEATRLAKEIHNLNDKASSQKT